MKNLFYRLLIAALISFAGCKKILIKPLPTLNKFGTVYENVYTNPLQDVTITLSVCHGYGIATSCNDKGMVITEIGGGFAYPKDVNKLAFAKTGYKSLFIDLRETLPPNVNFVNDNLVVRMEK